MVRTILIPKSNTLDIKIPDSYIGKEVEILLYTKDEFITEVAKPKTMADFWGKLSDETAKDLNSLTEIGRNEWENNTVK
jgi:hypothetical protein